MIWGGKVFDNTRHVIDFRTVPTRKRRSTTSSLPLTLHLPAEVEILATVSDSHSRHGVYRSSSPPCTKEGVSPGAQSSVDVAANIDNAVLSR